MDASFWGKRKKELCHMSMLPEQSFISRNTTSATGRTIRRLCRAEYSAIASSMISRRESSVRRPRCHFRSTKLGRLFRSRSAFAFVP